MIPHDMKAYGQQPERMPTPLRRLCQVLVAIAVIGTAYGLVADEADRVVVMSRATFEQTIAAERIKAAQEILNATECRGNWRDLFRDESAKKRTGAM